MWGAKFELECLLLLIFIYRNSKFVVICKNADSECWYIVYWTHTKDKCFLTSHSPFCLIIIKITPTILPSLVIWNLLFWCCHQMSFALFNSNIKNTKSSFVLLFCLFVLFCFVCLFVFSHPLRTFTTDICSIRKILWKPWVNFMHLSIDNKIASYIQTTWSI